MSDDPALSSQAQRLLRSGERMRSLLDDLLDYNRVALHVGIRVRPDLIDAGAACQEEIEVLRASLPEISIELSQEGDVRGRWDGSRIRQAVHNLVVNAARYGDPGGQITIQVMGSDAHLTLCVENAGPTIPNEIAESLFEPLRRTSPGNLDGERESLGLGLFIVKQIAEAHGGVVTVQSADRKTRFTISLPKGD